MKNTILADRYTMDHIVGEGAYSTVFKGWDRDMARPVAIKRLKTDGLTKDEYDEAQELFFREIKFLETLDHPSIPRYYDFVFQDGFCFLVMEWVEGKNLLDIVKEKGTLSMKEALWYMEKITDVLIYLQTREQSVIFKDIKPSNIMLDNLGRVRIIDFGTARIFSAEKDRDSHTLGTPGYAPPEAYKEDAQTNLSSDIYSLGATMYHLTTGKEPFQFKFSFPKAKQFNPQLTQDFADLLDECLKINKEERLPDALALKKRLKAVQPPFFDIINTFKKNIPEVVQVTLWYILVNVMIIFSFATGMYVLNFGENEGLLQLLNSLVYFSILSFIIIFMVYNLIVVVSSLFHR